MEKAKQTKSASEALNSLAAYCARAERAPFDLFMKLYRWGFNSEDAEAIVNQLSQQGFVDEVRYANAFAHDKHEFNNWGKIKIVNGLRAKRIPQTIINQAIALIDDANEEENLQDLLVKKLKTLAGKEPKKMRDSLLRFAISRGYTLDATLKAVGRLDIPLPDEYPY